MNNKIAILIPEFPGQTHNFFWRERSALTELGVDALIISTRRPHKNLMAPSWSNEALAVTEYLYPLGLINFFRTFNELSKLNAKGWLELRRLISASDLTWKDRLGLIAMIPFAINLSRILDSYQISHVHVHSLGNAANIVVLASIICSVKYSVTLHSDINCFGKNQREKFGRASFAVFVANKLYQNAHHIVGSNIPKILSIVPMGVDIDKFARKLNYEAYGGSGYLKIFTCARLNPGKGLGYLVDAVKKLVNSGIQVHLSIAGEDDVGGRGYRKILIQKISDNGLQDNISLLGSVSEERIRDELELAHLFVLPSLNEAIGVSLMEAMAMGIPCIATKVGGIPELIENGVDGFLVEPENSHEIANAIKLIMGNPGKALSVSQLSRDKIVANFHHRRSACEIKKMMDLTASI